MADALLVVGLILIGIGVVLLVYQTFTSPAPEPVAQDLDLAKVIEEIRKILEGVEKRFRVPLIILFTGLTLDVLGVYLKARDAADEPQGLIALLGLG
jgi:hypothetical protein